VLETIGEKPLTCSPIIGAKSKNGWLATTANVVMVGVQRVDFWISSDPKLTTDSYFIENYMRGGHRSHKFPINPPPEFMNVVNGSFRKTDK
jgi:hypothetical protein